MSWGKLARMIWESVEDGRYSLLTNVRGSTEP
jgi:hypothetical protein